MVDFLDQMAIRLTQSESRVVLELGLNLAFFLAIKETGKTDYLSVARVSISRIFE
jgi:hypothetical protein